MSNILYIKANVKPEGMSRTFRISDSFLENYKNKNPGDSITTLDLYKEGIGFLSADDLTTWFSPKTEQSRSHPMLKYAYQFLDADKYIISAPMWNLSVPAIFKAYIDYVTVNGITFRWGCAAAKKPSISSPGAVSTARGPAQHLKWATDI